MLDGGDPNISDLTVPRPSQVSASVPFAAGVSAGDEVFAPAGLGLADYLRILRKRKATIILVTFACVLLGIGAALPETPLYRASAQVEIQALNEDLGYSKDLNPSSNNGALFPDVDLATEVKVLSTRSLLERVINKLDADTSLRIEAPIDRLAVWRRALRLPSRAAPERRQVLESAAASIQVKSFRTTRVVEIQCDSPDPNLAAVFANTMASEYIEQSIESRWQAARHTGDWLNRQLDEIKATLEKSEDQLQGYATSMNLVFTGDKDRSNVSQERLSQIQAELSAAQGDRVVKQARYEQALSGPPDALGQVVDDAALRNVDSKLLELRREMAEITVTLGPAHDRVRKVRAQIEELEGQQKKARDRVVERISNDYREADRREKLLLASYQAQSGVLSDQASKITHYNILKREVETNRQLYDSLLQKVKEAGVGAALRASNVQIIDRAEPPSVPFNPDLKHGALLGMCFGVFGSFSLVMVQEKLSRRIHAPGEALAYLNAPELGVVPSWSVDRAAYRKKGGDPPIATFQCNQSLAAEAFRVILTSILYLGRRRPARVIVVGSPGASEGKTTVISNLAMGFAETNRSVLVIDCDMRRPRLHELFGLDDSTGIADLLARKEPLEARDLILAAQGTRFAGVNVLPCGQYEAGAAGLLHSKRLGELIALAREQFDVVLIDTPPLLYLADARVVGSFADGMLIVIRSGQTSRESVMAIRQRLEQDGIPVLGSVLNDWNPKAAGYYGYETYSQYYAAYDSRVLGAKTGKGTGS
jgi:capsular exopolysaccharide synthesis family protein